ncbi:MAG TPA: hydroxymethylbilane synthase [Chlamydiales bacterium]|nr:hydroxymethylbilane synthase [Chlamydiales bacterium]
MRLGARSSPLSRAQVAEFLREFPLPCEVIWVETTGDKDKTTSLRTLDKTDFFTRELDQMLLSHEIDAALHSAKDLPDPLPEGLTIAHLTEGLDPRDSLVIKKEPVHLVATSSVRREEAVRLLYPHCQFMDLRGTIQERLAKDVDGVVIAEAALIRLQLTHLKRVFLPGPTAPLQGKLALITRAHEHIIPRT